MTTFSPACLRRRRSGTVSFLRSSGTKLGLLGSLVERLHLPADRVRVRGEGRFVEVRLGPRLGVEMAVLVDAAHHNFGIMMACNMNLTFPIADWMMGTSDVKRSLLGTLFNGYNQDHVRPELKPTMERFRRPDAPVTIDGPITQQPA